MSTTNQTSKSRLAGGAESEQSEKNQAADPNARVTFATSAVDMSWQLAIIVLVPIVGGYKLDTRLQTTPLWTLIGLVVAMVGSIFVIKRTLAAFGKFGASDTPTPSTPLLSTGRTSKPPTSKGKIT